MGISPRGSNGRPRSALIFATTEDRDLFKSLASDLAEQDHIAPTEAVLDAVIHRVVSTPEGEQAVRVAYSGSSASCRAIYADVFRQLLIAGDKGRNALPIIESLISYIAQFDARIDAADDEISHLASLWDRLVDVLDQLATDGDPDSHLAAQNARMVGTGVLRDSRAIVSPSVLVLMLKEQWGNLHDRHIAYAILLEISDLIRPTRRGVSETARDRLELLRTIDRFYMGGEEVGPAQP